MKMSQISPEPISGDSGSNQEVDLNDVHLGYYIDLYKKAVDVQQHFNDIQWRIRGLALTVATFAIGAAGVAAKDGTRIWAVSLGSIVALVGLLLWEAFYYVDRNWYHPFLKSAVSAGQKMETVIRKKLPDAGMTALITEMSPQEPNLFQKRFIKLGEDKKMHSEHRLSWFYLLGRTAFVVVAVALQLGVCLGQTPVSGVAPTPNASPTVSAAPQTP